MLDYNTPQKLEFFSPNFGVHFKLHISTNFLLFKQSVTLLNAL